MKRPYPTCGGGHNQPTKAVALVSWPRDRYNTELACVSHLDYLVSFALDNDEVVLIEPIGKGSSGG